jgi:hypothetical protein
MMSSEDPTQGLSEALVSRAGENEIEIFINRILDGIQSENTRRGYRRAITTFVAFMAERREPLSKGFSRQACAPKAGATPQSIRRFQPSGSSCAKRRQTDGLTRWKSSGRVRSPAWPHADGVKETGSPKTRLKRSLPLRTLQRRSASAIGQYWRS